MSNQPAHRAIDSNTKSQAKKQENNSTTGKSSNKYNKKDATDNTPETIYIFCIIVACIFRCSFASAHHILISKYDRDKTQNKQATGPSLQMDNLCILAFLNGDR